MSVVSATDDDDVAAQLNDDKNTDNDTLSSSTLSEETGNDAKDQRPSFSFDISPIDNNPTQTTNIMNNNNNQRNITSSSLLTVGLLIIGNEIIKGQISDSNTYSAALAIRSNPNLKLARVVIVPDEFDAIVSEIKSLLQIVDIIITSGGIGPTHDDITIASVGAAL